MFKAVVFDIKRFAIYDGPGIRTTIFFKGCSLDCAWCQNPESKLIRSQLFYDRRKCISCNRCVDVCPLDKISSENGERFDSSKACPPDCEKCYEGCPSGAIYKVGKEYRVDELFDLMTKDIDFFKTSGGGVTLSGGEPMVYIDFIKALIDRLETCGIDVIIETAGNVKWDSFKKILDHHIKYYYDIKLIDEGEHKKYTGHSNKLLLDNLISLHRAKKYIIIRIPLIPEITDTEKNLRGIIGFMKENSLIGIPIELLPYNQLAETKFNKKGINCGSVGPYFKPGMKTQEREFLFKKKKLFTENNITAKILSIE
jgi:pyruvate formate lyase activating enzyme